MFWADQLAQKIIKERPQDEYLVTDEKTPSGRIHVGSLSGLLYHAAIAKALQKKGKKSIFQYGFDDYDAMDSLPVYLPKEYEKYLGIPLSEIPSSRGKGSFGDYYADEFIKVFNDLGENPKVVHTSNMYKTGEFNQAIKTALDKAKIIIDIYKKVARQERPKDWLPVQMVCKQCGKIGTTRAYEWDGKEISYKCESDWVKYTRGCKFEGKGSPYDGNSKLPWKVEWAAKWFIWKSDVEGAGKDHMTLGGSHDVAATVCEKVYNQKPPEKFRYEFFLVKGKKMSSSKGLGHSAKEVSDALPPELLRFLIIRSSPNSQINFTLDSQTIIKLFNDFDRAHGQFIRRQDTNDARAFEYALINNKMPEHLMRFAKIVSLVQISYVDIALEAEKEKGSPLTEQDKSELKKRIAYAKLYLQKFSLQAEKFEIQKELPRVKLNEKQKELIQKIVQFMAGEKFTAGGSEPEKLHNFIYETGKGLGLSPKDTFESIYKIFLNKTSGPKAGWFLAAVDKKFAVDRLREGAK